MTRPSEIFPAGVEQEARSSHPVDLHVGRRLRARRKQFGIVQEKMADALGLTFQQVQKYERGANRISASKLYAAALFLKTTPGWFFDGLPMDAAADQASAQADDTHLEPVMALASLPQGCALARDFGALPERHQRLVAKMARELAEASAAGVQ